VSVSGGQAHLSGNGTWNNYVLLNEGLGEGQAVTVTFKVSSSAYSNLHLNSGSSGQADYRRWGLLINNNQILRESCVGAAPTCETALLMNLTLNTWYTGRLVTDSRDQFTARVWPTGNPGGAVENKAAHTDWKDLTWKFKDFAITGVQELDTFRLYPRFGIGQRTKMSDSSGETRWVFDARRRMSQEIKRINGSGTFVTQWAYDSADQVVVMSYPGDNLGGVGERLSHNYYPQSALRYVYSQTNNYYYLQQAVYDAAGRSEYQTFGAADLAALAEVKIDPMWFSWQTANGAGRLKQIRTTSPANPSLPVMQDLRYYVTGTSAPRYDAVGNLLGIEDYVMGSPQVQTFQYDVLNRLTSAVATGGANGTYSEAYTYNTATGNLASKGTASYIYGAQAAACPDGALSKPHAVVTFDTNKSYCYDRNGNMVRRKLGMKVFNLTYDAENRLASVSGGDLASFLYDGDGQRVKGTVAQNYASGITPSSDVTLNNPLVVTDGDYWANSSSEYASTASGLHYLQVDLGAVFTLDRVRVWHYANDGRTYHNTKTQVSSDGVSWFTVFDSAVSGEYPETAAGRTHTFTARSVRYIRDYLNGNTVNAYNHWVELEGLAPDSVATYLGDYLEWTGSTSTMKKYYYAAGQRIAVRVGSTLYWLLGDHLGSTQVSVQTGTYTKAEIRFRPFGETRHPSATLPTDFKFTGQREVAVAGGLYFFKARWYDGLLARFIQADSIIPNAYDPRSYDRYAYVLNRPTVLTDPSGHKACDNEGDGWDCKGGGGGAYFGMSFLQRMQGLFHIRFIGDWSDNDKSLVYRAIFWVGSRLAKASTLVFLTPWQAFNAVYNATPQNPFRFLWSSQCDRCQGANAYTHGARLIEFQDLSSNSCRAINNIVHELGHAFDWAVYEALGDDFMPRLLIDNYWSAFRRPDEYFSKDYRYYGLAGPREQTLWHQNGIGAPHEEFADTFLGWVFGAWESDPSGKYSAAAIGRIRFMNLWTPLWVNVAATQ
jgi:RHS repeat-associated protein